MHRNVSARGSFATAAPLVFWFALTGGALGRDPGSLEFFENRIRPVLVEHCYECHRVDSEVLGGGLVLQHADGMIAGGDSGPAVVPGDVEASELIAAIRYESTEMPPDGRLDDQTIADFEAWISAGAIDPRQASADSGPVAPEGIDLERGRAFWAFGRPEASGDRSIDAHLDDAMEAAGIEPLSPAPPAAQLRRLSYDLTGLPPTADQLRRWMADPTPRLWRQLADQMLASPDFGTHWARHWMDVARYADSNGSDFNATFHDAWRYRDYLIRSFNADVPFDEMIRQQIAGDLMGADDPEERFDQIVATTFLMLGTKMLSERDKTKLTMDVVDEQIDTLGRAFMGLTLGCARCHDHKFDPIPTRDYYALAGIFRSTRSLRGTSQPFVSTWEKTPLPIDDEWAEALAKHQRQTDRVKDELAQVEAELKTLDQTLATLPGVIVDDAEATLKGRWVKSTHIKPFVGDGYRHDDNRHKAECSARFDATLRHPGRYEVRLHYLPGASRAELVPVVSRVDRGNVVERHDGVVDQSRVPSDSGNWRVVDGFVLGVDHGTGVNVSVEVSNRGTSGHVIVDAVQWVLLDGPAPADDSVDGGTRRSELLKRQQEIEKRLQALQRSQPPRQPTAMAVADLPEDQIADCPLMIRGEPHRPGDSVPRGFLQVCRDAETSTTVAPILRGSGRLELAQWLTDPNHPLTARVYVNRVWMHLMGQGLVRTVDNFGLRGERPSHPKLLDDLAVRFVRDRWDTKHLIRQIVHSKAYRRATTSRAAMDRPAFVRAESIDPTNRLLWRAHRRPLPAEAVRDSMLVAAGGIDRRTAPEPLADVGVLISRNVVGSEAAATTDLADDRRTAELLLIRSAVPPLLAHLDAADPDLLVGQRPTTNVPATAMVLMGSPEVQTWATRTANRMIAEVPGRASRVGWLTRTLWGRHPTPADESLLGQWVGDDRATRLIAAMFASTEFRMLD